MVDPARRVTRWTEPSPGPQARYALGCVGRRLDDLHDAVIQTLFGVGLTLEAAAATSGQEGLADRLQEAAGHLARVVRELREYAAPDSGGRPDAVLDMSRPWNVDSGLDGLP